jgi:hypothetical protein
MLMMEKILEVLKNSRAQLVCAGALPIVYRELDELIKLLERPNPDKYGFYYYPDKYDLYYWVLQVAVHKNWVEDGADFTDERTHDMMTQHFSHLFGSEVKGKVLGRPPDETVAKEMGFESTETYLEDRKKDE